MFSVIYALLFVVWVLVLNHKIQTGPQPVHAAEYTTAAELLDVTGGRADHSESLSEAKQPPEPFNA
jgi:hypothetical protein